jgi:hypothetical protein
MEPNVGMVDGLLRITFGLTGFGMGIVKKSPLLMMYGGMKVAEGIVGWCPVYELFGISTLEDKFEFVSKSGDCCCEEYYPDEENDAGETSPETT